MEGLGLNGTTQWSNCELVLLSAGQSQPQFGMLLHPQLHKWTGVIKPLNTVQRRQRAGTWTSPFWSALLTERAQRCICEEDRKPSLGGLLVNGVYRCVCFSFGPHKRVVKFQGDAFIFKAFILGDGICKWGMVDSAGGQDFISLRRKSRQSIDRPFQF